MEEIMQLVSLLFTLCVGNLAAPQLSPHNLLSLQLWLALYFDWPLTAPLFLQLGFKATCDFGSSLLAWPLDTALFLPLVLDPLLLLMYERLFLSHLL